MRGSMQRVKFVVKRIAWRLDHPWQTLAANPFAGFYCRERHAENRTRLAKKLLELRAIGFLRNEVKYAFGFYR